MNFDILSSYKYSQCDYSAILKFDNWDNAREAVRIIGSKPYATGLSAGESGAYRVGTYVMLNVFSKETYLDLIQELRDAAPAVHQEPAGGIEDTMYDILAEKPEQETNERSRRIDKLAARFIAENIPGATYIEHETYYEDPTRWIEAWFDYEGKRFHVDFCLEEDRNWLNLWSINPSDGYNVDVTVVTPDTIKDAISRMDPDGQFQPDETGSTPPGADPELPVPTDRIGKLEARVGELEKAIQKLLNK